MINKRCDEVYDLGRDVSIDEAMIKFQGRSALKQYVPKKPIKRGIKVWVLADSENGYFHTMEVYKGKENTPEKHLGSRVVKDLAAPLKNKYHHVYFDKFFSSVGLLEDLRDDGIYACGTARTDRVGFPEALKRPKLTNRYSM